MMSLDECKKHAANGEPCQMMTPDGKWVPFNETQVITKFRVAPRLFDNSGPRIVMYALLRLEKMVERHFRNTFLWIDLPQSGFKEDWTLTAGYHGKLGARDIRVEPSIEDQVRAVLGKPKTEYLDRTDLRLRDIFRTYFRVRKVKSTEYEVQCRSLTKAPCDNNWTTIFRVKQEHFKEHDDFNLASKDAPLSWCIETCADYSYIPKEWKERLGTYQYSTTERYRIRQQRIRSVSKITPCGTEILNNIALWVCNYLTFISHIDMNMKDFSDFIENNMEKTDSPTHRLVTPGWTPNNRSLVIYYQYSEFAKYRDAALGRRQYDENGYLDYRHAHAILLRYFNMKYHGTIYEVREKQ